MPLANINEPETEMLIWYIILATTIAVTCAGLLFLANRIARSPSPQSSDKKRPNGGKSSVLPPPFFFLPPSLSLLI